MLRLLQLRNALDNRAIALADDTTLRVLNGPATAYEAAQAAFSSGTPLEQFLNSLSVSESISYDDAYAGKGEWTILAPFMHPADPARCLVSGTGLTHLASAETRSKMHTAGAAETDSMKMYRWGEEGGRPAAGEIGTAPEWFYKGNGWIVRAHNEPLDVPSFAGDGGEEPEIAGVYMIDEAGNPRRIGLAAGNEFSDHITERKNYLYLAPSKLRQCSLGPELIVGGSFEDVPGVVKIERAGEVIWSKEIGSGEQRMSHSRGNMEHHHFKFPEHRRPGDVHIHFFGAGAFSFGDGLQLQDGDISNISFEGFGRPLRNSVRVDKRPDTVVAVTPA